MKRALLLLAACGAKPAPAPTPHAAAPQACEGVTVDAKAVAGAQYPSWLAAWTALAHTPQGETLLPDGASPPTDDASARTLLCGDSGCPDTGPWIVGAGTPGDRILFSLAMPVSDGLVVFPDLAEGRGGACQSQDDVDTTPGRYFEVTVTRNDAGTPVVDDRGDTECHPGTTDGVDYRWFDATAGTRVLSITTSSTTQITTTANTVHVVAGGCTEDAPLLKPEA